MKSVKGKVVLITGGALGMGRELAKMFAKDGARIVLWDLRQSDLDKTAEEIKQLGAEVHTYVCDVTNRQLVYDTAARVKKEVGIVDILDNNAGIVFAGKFLDVPDEKLFKTIDVNVNGIMWCTKAFLPDMIKRNQGHIIMMASAAGLIGVGGLAVYCATKHAVVGFSDALRVELKNQNISGVKITIVCPSFVQTGMFEGVKPPLFTPWLTTEQMTAKIYNGCLKEKYYVREPLMVKFIPLLKGIATTRAVDRTGILLGMNNAANTWHGRTDQEKYIK
jgi:all-trans-retinol dehydrogenase (NAD+)